MLVVASISQTYLLGIQWCPVLPLSTMIEFKNSEIREAPSLNRISGRDRSGLEKPHILSVYTFIHRHCKTWTESQVKQCYAPGSILTFHGKTLVGRARNSLGIWIVNWDTGLDKFHHDHHIDDRFVTIMISTFCCPSLWFTIRGSITVGSNLTEDSTVSLLHAGVVCYNLEIFPASSLAYSWIAQASQLYSSFHSGDHAIDDDLYMIGAHQLILPTAN